MIRLLCKFKLKAFYKSNYSRLIFVLAALAAAAFMIIGTALDRRAVASFPESVSENLRFVRLEQGLYVELGYAFTHPNFELIRNEVTVYTFMEDLFRWGRQPGWREILELQTARKHHVLNAINRWEEISMAANGENFGDFIFMLPHRFTVEFGSTQGLMQSIWLAERLLEIDLPPLSSPYEMSGYQFLYKSLRMFFPILIPLLTLALNNGIPLPSRIFLHTKPISKLKESLSELVASFVPIYLFTVPALLLGFLTSSIVSGVGHSNFPLSETQTVFDAVLLRIALLPVFVLACGVVELFCRNVYTRIFMK